MKSQKCCESANLKHDPLASEVHPHRYPLGMDRESFNRIAVDFNPAVADYAQARTPFRPRVEPLA
jgi:hypothetical protein